MTTSPMPEAQARLDALNAEDPPSLWPPPVIANVRHPCRPHPASTRKANLSLPLHEVYWVSDDGEHAFIFREGRCSRCGTVARSRTGRVVLTASRPPLYGRQAR